MVLRANAAAWKQQGVRAVSSEGGEGDGYYTFMRKIEEPTRLVAPVLQRPFCTPAFASCDAAGTADGAGRGLYGVEEIVRSRGVCTAARHIQQARGDTERLLN